ncbi:MAG: hypothetical protein HYV08_16495, partial [Deltaproteobacteria bacterium]|nr:hypothetical protein [Deltaproteobacteria bacterium]
MDPARPAIVAVNVNRPPVAGHDAATTRQGIAVQIPLLTNDSDPDGQLAAATVVVTQLPANGT